ncbi:hypothetical protein H2202_008714 [Exophiala xenobiotica]|nr:hypothetical protein H2202_008714 [Exophiala xenobiotica]
MAFGELTSNQDSSLHAFDPKSALIAGVMGQFASTLIGHIRADTYQPSNPHALEVLDIGTCAVVHVLDEDRVIKIFPLPLHPNDTESLQLLTIEQRAYERLGHHPRICRYISKEKNGLVLERLEKNLGKYLCTLQEGGVDCTLAWVWSIQIAESVAFAHSKGVLHADLGCHNVLLDYKNDAKLCDFAGSSIDGEDAKISYKARHQMYTEDENDGRYLLLGVPSTNSGRLESLMQIWMRRRLKTIIFRAAFLMWKASQVDQLFRSVGTETLQPHKQY